MSSTISLLAFLPEEAVILIVMAGGFALMFGAKKLAGTLFTLSALMIFLPPLLEPVLDALPEWALWLLLGFVMFSVIGLGFRLLIGRGATEQMVGTLAADVVRSLFLAPFRGIRWVFRLFGRVR